jgi:hypothetical protein
MGGRQPQLRWWRWVRTVTCWPAFRKAALGHADMLDTVATVLTRHTPADPSYSFIRPSAINVVTAPTSPIHGAGHRRSLSPPAAAPRAAWASTPQAAAPLVALAGTSPPTPSSPPARGGGRLAGRASATGSPPAPSRRISPQPPTVSPPQHARSPLSTGGTAFTRGAPSTVVGANPRIAALAVGHSRAASQDSVLSRRISGASPAGSATRPLVSPSDPLARARAYSPGTRRTSDVSGVGDADAGEIVLSRAAAAASVPPPPPSTGAPSPPAAAPVSPPPEGGEAASQGGGHGQPGATIPPPRPAVDMTELLAGAGSQATSGGGEDATHAAAGTAAPAPAVPPRSPASSQAVAALVSGQQGRGGGDVQSHT